MRQIATFLGLDRHELRRRVVIVTIIVALHALLFLTPLAATHRTASTPAGATMTIHEIRQEPDSRPIEIDRAPNIAVTALPVELSPPSMDEHPACDVSDPIGSALASDPRAHAALASTGNETAHTIMVWDGRWSDTAAAEAVRATIADALKAQPAACLDEQMAGPRLIFPPIPGRAITVAVGSGTWTWRQLLSFDGYPTIVTR